MKKHTLLFAVVCAPALAAFTLPTERVSFSPSEGATLDKSFSLETSMTLEDMSMLMNGNPPPMDASMDMSGTTTMSVSVSDEYVALGEGRPAKLHRTYSEISTGGASTVTMPMGMGEQEITVTGTSELEGLTVVFDWDADEEEFTPSFPEGEEGDEELLEDLEENMDLRFLLPDGDVAEGDEWQVDPNMLRHLLSPGGGLSLDTEVDGGDMGMGGGDMGMDSDFGQMLGDVEGTFTAKLAGMRDADDRTVAVIELSLDVESSNDLTEMIREQLAEAGENPMGAEMEISSADVELTAEGGGELLWDMEGGHFHSLDVTLDMTTTTDTAMAMSMQGQDMDLEQSMEFSATQTISATAERQ